MSATVLYAVQANGDVGVAGEIRNSWHSAYRTWTEIARLYAPSVLRTFGSGEPSLPHDRTEMEPIWKLGRDERLLPHHRAALVTTFDWVIVPTEALPEVVAAFRQCAEEWPGSSLDGQAVIIERAMRDVPGLRGIAWNQTNVNGRAWEGPRDPEGDDYLPYNVDRDGKHWWWPREPGAAAAVMHEAS